MDRKGFTLIEIMVVVAMIAVLSVVLIPQISSAVNKARVTRTAQELRNISNAMDAYLIDVGSYPPGVGDLGRTWGADMGLVSRAAVVSSHLSSWNGPYLKDWPVRTAWGGLKNGAIGVYFVHQTIAGYIDRDGIQGNDMYVHMNNDYGEYPPAMAIEIDKVTDDGVGSTGNVRTGRCGTGGGCVDFYVGEGIRSW